VQEGWGWIMESESRTEFVPQTPAHLSFKERPGQPFPIGPLRWVWLRVVVVRAVSGICHYMMACGWVIIVSYTDI